MSASAEQYALALREAATVIAVMGEQVHWVDDCLSSDESGLAVKWHFPSPAEAEAFRDRMVAEFHPTYIQTVPGYHWGYIRMDIPQYPTVDVEITFPALLEERH